MVSRELPTVSGMTREWIGSRVAGHGSPGLERVDGSGLRVWIWIRVAPNWIRPGIGLGCLLGLRFSLFYFYFNQINLF